MSTAYTAPAPDPISQTANPYQQIVTPVHTSPFLAFALGFIPGVGAIYNGQYVKGLVHAVIAGLLISLASASDEAASQPFIVMVAICFWAYMAFEAFHTAKRRQAGLPVEEWSSLVTPGRSMPRAPIGPVLLIVLGVLFLLDNLHLIAFRELARFWPILLIAVGFIMLYNRINAARSSSHTMAQPMESSHEQ
jgi:TM2 domain-containing membrane protein YozV